MKGASEFGELLHTDQPGAKRVQPGRRLNSGVWLQEPAVIENGTSMSKTWLKMIGTTEEPCPASWTVNHVHFRKEEPRGIHPGDHMVLYAVGRKKRVFALAEVTSEVYENGQEEWCYQMDVKYLLNLPVESGVSIDQIRTERNLIGPIKWGSSYFELEPEEYTQAVALLTAPPASSAVTSSQATQVER